VCGVCVVVGVVWYVGAVCGQVWGSVVVGWVWGCAVRGWVGGRRNGEGVVCRCAQCANGRLQMAQAATRPVNVRVQENIQRNAIGGSRMRRRCCAQTKRSVASRAHRGATNADTQTTRVPCHAEVRGRCGSRRQAGGVSASRCACGKVVAQV